MRRVSTDRQDPRPFPNLRVPTTQVEDRPGELEKKRRIL